ncbi:MAG: Ger(x)C family spore germination protein [Clostridia bacterium]|nr:Ger(x)C family spore germination protein [Clostridia bacterium]
MDRKVKERILFVLVLISGIMLFLDLIEYKLAFYTSGGIENSSFVLAVGVDKADSKDNKYKITTISEKFSADSSSNSSTNQKAEDIFTVEGTSVFQAIRNYNMFKSKTLEWGHIGYILISEEVAKEDVLDVLDFFIRDHQLRFNAKLIVVKDLSAEAFIRSGKKIGKFLPDLLDSVFSNEEKTSVSSNVDLVEFVRILDDKYVDVFIPSITLLSRENDEAVFKKLDQTNKKNNEKSDKDEGEKNLEAIVNKEDKEKSEENKDSQENKGSQEGSSSQDKGSSKEQSESDEKTQYCLTLNGFAIFKELKLIGYLEEIYARGLNWLKANIKTTAIVLDDVYGEEVTVEVLRSELETKIKFNDDNPEVTYNIKFITNLSEINGHNDVSTKEGNQIIVDKQNEKVKSEVEAVINYAKENSVDIFNLSDAIYKSNPDKWNKIKENWDDVLKNMKIDVNVNSKITRTYHIRQPIRSGYGEKK